MFFFNLHHFENIDLTKPDLLFGFFLYMAKISVTQVSKLKTVKSAKVAEFRSLHVFQ